MGEREWPPVRDQCVLLREPRRHNFVSSHKPKDECATVAKRARTETVGAVLNTPASVDFYAWQSEQEAAPRTKQQDAVLSDAQNAGRNAESSCALVPTGCSSGASRGSVDDYRSLQELLRRVIAMEFSERCTKRSIALVQTICDTMCTEPMVLVKVMEVLDQCFSEAVRMKQQSLLLNYWYILDAVLKLFRGKPAMLNVIVVALPHLIRQYLPWKGSALSREPWMECHKDKGRYESMFLTWERVVPQTLLDGVKSLWEGDYIKRGAAAGMAN